MITDRPLANCVVGISISETGKTGEMEALGFDQSEMNRCVVRLSESLLGAGARLAFGHDWRPGGVMVAVAALAVRYFNAQIDLGSASAHEAPIINRVPWPRTPFLADQEKTAEDDFSKGDQMARMLKGIVDARQTEVPPDTTEAEALSLMREELAELCHLRVCLGGKLSGFSGKIPGIVEEALGALRRGRPVFASAIFGGASRLVARELEGLPTDSAEPLSDEARGALAEIRELSANVPRGLSTEEDRLLWHCTSIEQCVELILRGAVKYFRK